MKTFYYTLIITLFSCSTILAQWGTNGSSIYYNNGKIGIGTASPAYKIDISGAGANAVIQINPSSNANNKSSWVYHSVGGVLKSAIGYRHTTDALSLYHNGDDRMIIKNSGDIGIGTTNPGAKLAVNGDIHAKEVRVNLIGWPDFVFKNDYILPSLEAVEAHIKAHGHLKDIPSEAEVKENGINLGEMDAKLLQKIEELTLYIIALNKKVKKLESENSALKAAFNIKE